MPGVKAGPLALGKVPFLRRLPGLALAPQCPDLHGWGDSAFDFCAETQYTMCA